MSSINVQKHSDVNEVETPQGPSANAVEKGAQPDPAKEKRARSAAGRVGLFVLLLLVGSLAWHVASDLVAPSTSSGAVSASTTQIAPRAAGQVAEIFVVDNQEVERGQPLFALDPIDREQPWVVVDLRENQLANVETGDPVSLIFDAVPGRIFKGQVRGIAWGIDPGRMAANGLPQNQPSTRWFEPARTIPVQIALAQDEAWPENVRAGSKAGALIFATDPSNPIALVSRGLQVIQTYLSYLY